MLLLCIGVINKHLSVEEEKSGLEMTSGLLEAWALTPYTEGICLGKEEKVAQN